MDGHGSNIVMLVVGVSTLISMLAIARSAMDCTTVTGLVATCSIYITNGAPDPKPGSPCCDALLGLNNLAESTDDMRSVCKCLMGLITTYNPNATAIATLPGLCGINFGFTINPNTDCNNIGSEAGEPETGF